VRIRATPGASRSGARLKTTGGEGGFMSADGDTSAPAIDGQIDPAGADPAKAALDAALVKAVQAGNLQQVEELRALGANPNANIGGITGLSVMTENNDVQGLTLNAIQMAAPSTAPNPDGGAASGTEPDSEANTGPDNGANDGVNGQVPPPPPSQDVPAEASDLRVAADLALAAGMIGLAAALDSEADTLRNDRDGDGVDDDNESPYWVTAEDYTHMYTGDDYDPAYGTSLYAEGDPDDLYGDDDDDTFDPWEDDGYAYYGSDDEDWGNNWDDGEGYAYDWGDDGAEFDAAPAPASLADGGFDPSVFDGFDPAAGGFDASASGIDPSASGGPDPFAGALDAPSSGTLSSFYGGAAPQQPGQPANTDSMFFSAATLGLGLTLGTVYATQFFDPLAVWSAANPSPAAAQQQPAVQLSSGAPRAPAFGMG
jgi:hypothetical protein